MSDRLTKIVNELIPAIAKVLVDNNVTREEYRAGIGHLAKTQADQEIPLLCDVFLEPLVVKGEDARSQNSAQAVEGPYFIEDIPWVEGALAISPDDFGEPMIIRGRVSAPDGMGVEGATVFVWHSTPDGAYLQ